MSRMAAPIASILVVATSPAMAQDAPLTAEQAIDNSRQMFSVGGADCAPTAPDDEEIVVCKRTGRAPRLPLPAERGPREGPRTATGEIAAASAAPVRKGSCGVQASDQGCIGGLPIIAGAILLVKMAGKLIDPDQ